MYYATYSPMTITNYIRSGLDSSINTAMSCLASSLNVLCNQLQLRTLHPVELIHTHALPELELWDALSVLAGQPAAEKLIVICHLSISIILPCLRPGTMVIGEGAFTIRPIVVIWTEVEWIQVAVVIILGGNQMLVDIVVNLSRIAPTVAECWNRACGICS